jgi:hypothetical protein
MVGLKQWELHRDSFRQLKILTIYSPYTYITETILYAKEKGNCTVKKQIHTNNIRNNNYYNKYIHNLELYKSKTSVAGCIFYNKLPNNNQFKKELKNLLINRCYYSLEDHLNQEYC